MADRIWKFAIATNSVGHRRGQHMNIKLPYAFQISGKVPGSRKIDRVIAADWLSVNIASADLLDAPVIMSWVKTSQYNFFEDHSLGEEGRVDIRVFQDGFYRPIANAGEPLGVEAVATRVLIDYEPHSDKPQALANAQVDYTDIPNRYPRPSYVGETFSNEQDIVQALTERAEGLLILDGTLWERCKEPMLVLEEDFRSDPTIFISPAFLDKYEPGRSKYFTFAMDELDGAVTFAQNRPQPPGENVEITVSADIRTVVPELLSRYHLADDAVRHASEMVKSGGATELNRASPDYTRAWMEFSEALAKARLTQDDTEIQLLIDAWIDFAEQNNESNGAPDYDYEQSIAHSMQARFSDRTMEPEAIFAVTPKR
jgi:hypothetical protein